MQETLKQNLGFSAIGSVGTQLIGLLGFIVLARLLSPHEFGLVAMVAIITSLATMLIELGFGSAVIHKQDAGSEYYSTAFWSNLALSCTFFVLVALASGTVAAFFREPSLESVLLACCFLLPMNGLGVVPMAILQKQQAFRKVAAVELSALSVGMLAAISLAVIGAGVWALVANLLIAAAVRVVLLYLLQEWRPRFEFDRDALHQLWGYSKPLIGSTLVNYSVEHADRFLIGRMINSASVGLYDSAAKLLSIPVNLITHTFNRVMFPEYAKPSATIERKKAIQLKLLGTTLFATLPTLLLAGLFAESIVVSLLGERWIDMAYIVSMLSFALILRCIAALNVPVYLSEGRTDLLFKVTLFMRGNLLIAIVVGMTTGGLPGLLWALIIVRVINFFPALYFPGRLLGISWSDYARAMGRTVLTSAVLYILVSLYVRHVEPDTSSLLLLIVNLSLSGLLYLALSFVLNRRPMTDLMRLIPARAY